MYKVECCVCDYAIYKDNQIIPELIFNSRKNAEKVCEIMNLDTDHKVYEGDMRIFDIIQQEVRRPLRMEILSDYTYVITYNNEIVKRKRYEFIYLDKVYKCVYEFEIEKVDDNGFTVEYEYTTIKKDSVWHTPEDKDYRFIGGEVRLENNKFGWIEIPSDYLRVYFEEMN